MLQAIHDTGHTWYRPYMIQTIHDTGHTWYRPYMIQTIHDTGHTWYRPFYTDWFIISHNHHMLMIVYNRPRHLIAIRDIVIAVWCGRKPFVSGCYCRAYILSPISNITWWNYRIEWPIIHYPVEICAIWTEWICVNHEDNIPLWNTLLHLYVIKLIIHFYNSTCMLPLMGYDFTRILYTMCKI